VRGRAVTKVDKVVQGRLDPQAHRDHRDSWDSREQLACLEDRDLRVIQVLMVGQEYPVDMLASTSPSNLSVCYIFVYFFSYIIIFLFIIYLLFYVALIVSLRLIDVVLYYNNCNFLLTIICICCEEG